MILENIDKTVLEKRMMNPRISSPMISLSLALAIICLASVGFAQTKKADAKPVTSLTKAALAKLKKENESLEAKHKLILAKQKLELAASKAEIQKLTVQKELTEKRLEKQEASERAQMAKTKLRLEKEKLIFEESLNKLKREHETQKAKNDLTSEKQRVQKLDHEKQKNKSALKELEMKNRHLVLKLQLAELSNKAKKYEQSLSIRKKKESWLSQSNQEPIRKQKPFSKGTLVISDRRIPLNGPIFWGAANRITERLHYFNNKSTKEPIFLVIDYCPGGSVMEGYRIVKAIEASKAPVHVVVKSFAASMAAVITTLADESYAYPNAIILHHEMSTRSYGNMTNLKEQLASAREWEKRLMGPVSKKLGISIEEFRKGMYKSNSEGDWEEFADKAKKLGWVKHLVNEIQETGIVKNPDAVKRRSSGRSVVEEKRDAKGNRYMELPRLRPFDMYAIFNPDNYYR